MDIILPTGFCNDETGHIKTWTDKSENQILLILHENGTVSWTSRLVTEPEIDDLEVKRDTA